MTLIGAIALGCTQAVEEPVRSSSPSAETASNEPGSPKRDGRESDRRRLVEQIAARGIEDPAVLDALQSVPRHWFVPEGLQDHAYLDTPLPIGEGQTISQPAVVALMTEQLQIDEGDKVLEIGTGSGYQAAVLSEITPRVYTIEIVERLARRAKGIFDSHGFETIQVRIGDGYAGWPDQAPFDAIIVTAAPDHVPKPLVDQLKPGGRMVIPVGEEGTVQQLRVITKGDDGTVADQTLIPVRFVPMTGRARN